jgi:hypothetical protein
VVPRQTVRRLCRSLICRAFFDCVDDSVDEFSIHAYHHLGVQELGIEYEIDEEKSNLVLYDFQERPHFRERLHYSMLDLGGHITILTM